MISAMLVNAQAPVWNVKVGLGASSWMGDGFGSAKALFNQRIGVGVDIPLTGWVSFQTGLNWTSKGAKYSLVNDTKQTVNQNYFEMPLLAAFHIGTPKNFDVIISGGGYIGCGIVGKTEQKADDLKVHLFHWKISGNCYQLITQFSVTVNNISMLFSIQ